jgi:hypothetical protein
MIAVGTAVRLVIAFTTFGVPFDVESQRLVGAHLDDRPLEVYGLLSGQAFVGDDAVNRWPYPPGFFPFIAIAWAIDKATALPFHGLTAVPSIAADAGIAWAVQHFLGLRGATERVRLAGAGLVALGAAFGTVSGYVGQIDPVAFLPAVLALVVWETPGMRRRALVAGLLIGLGAAVKTVPLLLLVALVPTVRSPREGVTLVTAALAVPAAALAPFFLADPSGTATILSYSGGPGLGGLSLLVEPSLAGDWLTNNTPLELSSASEALYDASGLIVALSVVAAGLFLLRYRPSAIDAAVLLWLTVYTFIPNFFHQYIVWGLPFFIMAGHLRKVAPLQVLFLVTAVILYLRHADAWSDDDIALLYVPLMIAFIVIWAVALVVQVRRIVASRRRNPTGVLPPLAAPTLGSRAYAAESRTPV